MTSFLLFSAVLLVLALLFIVVPLLRYRPLVKTADKEIRKQKNIDLFRQSMADLERDRTDKVISEEEFARLQTEMQRSFLRDMDETGAAKQIKASMSGRLVPAFCILFVPVFSYLIYTAVGSASDLALPGIMEELTSAETADEQLDALNELAVFLQKRFERRDDDIQNGYMLGTLYLELEDYDAAIDTFSAMTDIMEDSPDKAAVLGQLAQSMYLADDSRVNPRTRAVIEQALALNPNEYAVMSLLAIEAFVNEDFQQAITYWRRQLIQMDANTQQAFSLRDRIARVEELLAETGVNADTGDAQTTQDSPSVTLIVDLDDSIRDRVNDSMRLFVYARNPAMPMPLAAQNLSLPDFPFEITLDESMAMIQGMTLSSANEIIVGARLSRSGGAVRQPGDIMVESEAFVLSEQGAPVSLTIIDIVE